MSNTISFENPNPLLAMLRAKQGRMPSGKGRVIYLDAYLDTGKPVAPHLIFANELLATYPGLLTDKDFDFRMQLGYLAQFSLSQAELTQALRSGTLYIVSEQGKEIHFPVEEQDVTQLVADCITIRELAASLLPAEQMAIRLRRHGVGVEETRSVLEQADLCRYMLRQTVASIIDAFQKSGHEVLSPIEMEALMPVRERVQIAREMQD